MPYLDVGANRWNIGKLAKVVAPTSPFGRILLIVAATKRPDDAVLRQRLKDLAHYHFRACWFNKQVIDMTGNLAEASSRFGSSV